MNWTEALIRARQNGEGEMRQFCMRLIEDTQLSDYRKQKIAGKFLGSKDLPPECIRLIAPLLQKLSNEMHPYDIVDIVSERKQIPGLTKSSKRVNDSIYDSLSSLCRITMTVAKSEELDSIFLVRKLLRTIISICVVIIDCNLDVRRIESNRVLVDLVLNLTRDHVLDKSSTQMLGYTALLNKSLTKDEIDRIIRWVSIAIGIVEPPLRRKNTD